jgi:hypothetical protein
LVIYKNILKIFILAHILKPPKRNILKHLKNDFKYRERICKDILIDSQAAKTMCEKLSVPSINYKALKGYVQVIGQNPFKLILMSDIQVRLQNRDNQ